VTFGAAEYTAREAFAKKGIKKNKTEEALLSLSSYSLLLLFPDSALNFTILLLIIRKKNMSEGPSFEAACRTLEDMFPDLDPIVVRSVLDAKDGDMNENDDEVISDESKQTRRELDEFCWNWRRVRGRAEERKHGWGWRGC